MPGKNGQEENKSEEKPIVYSLAKVQVATADREHSLMLDPNGTYVGLNIITHNTRKVYFDEWKKMEKCLGLILWYQGYGQSRLAQYEFVSVMKEFNEADETRRVLVRNKQNGKMY